MKQLVALLILVLLFVACSPAAPSATQPPPQPTNTAVPPEGAVEDTAEPMADGPDLPPITEPIEIEFWTSAGGPVAEVIDNQVLDFNNSQDLITVTNVRLGFRGWNERMPAAVAAGEPPVLTMMDYRVARFYANAGVLEPLDDYLSEEDWADFQPELLADLTLDGVLYAIPLGRSNQGLYYNKEILAEAELDPENPPATWEEFGQYAAAMTDPATGRVGSYGTMVGWYFEPIVNQWGGSMNDEACNVNFHESPEVIEAMHFFQGLLDEGYTIIPSGGSSLNLSTATEFLNGEVVMMMQSTAIQAFMDETVGFEWGFGMMPGGPAGRAVSHGGSNLAIGANATPEQKRAAWEFISYVTSTRKAAEFHMATGYVPSRLSVLDVPEVLTFHTKHPSWLVSAEQIQFAQPTSCVGLNALSYDPVMNEALDRILINGEDPETVLADAAAELQAEIDELKAAGSLIQ